MWRQNFTFPSYSGPENAISRKKGFVMTFFLQNLNTYNCHNNLIFLHVIIKVLKTKIQKKNFRFFNFIGIKMLIYKISRFFEKILAAVTAAAVDNFCM
jgi:hypothetical protein